MFFSLCCSAVPTLSEFHKTCSRECALQKCEMTLSMIMSPPVSSLSEGSATSIQDIAHSLALQQHNVQGRVRCQLVPATKIVGCSSVLVQVVLAVKSCSA